MGHAASFCQDSNAQSQNCHVEMVCRLLVHSCGRPGTLACLLLGDSGLEPKVRGEWGTGFRQHPWKRYGGREGGRREVTMQ